MRLNDQTNVFWPCKFSISDWQTGCNRWMTQMKQDSIGGWQQVKCDHQESRYHVDHCLFLLPRLSKYAFLQHMRTVENYKSLLLWLWILAVNWIIYITEQWNGAKWFEHGGKCKSFMRERHFAKEECREVKMCKRDTELTSTVMCLSFTE